MFSSVQRTGEEFDDPGVVACYAHRPPYPAGLHRRLLELARGRAHALDLGCGPGKLASALAPHFRRVTAVDPSALMLRAARAAGAEHRNIEWIHGRAEDVALDGPFDLAVVGAAIHWMRPELVLPRLANALRPEAPLVLVNGDEPSDASWIEAYRAHVIRWIRLGGATPRDPSTAKPAYADWIDIQGRETFTDEVDQAIDDLIEAEHSRATWSRACMGPEAAALFDRELRELLQPHAAAGRISYRTEATLVIARPRSEPQAFQNGG
ncbi:class I SAM-dependent methyltransferase [Inquilinus sp.]|jgi:SAM-dependent methyltransferase|uniref:class I SAM-dependent methyltransferase n=1 Tax=Inquilinus sp. TaxID=1932117 RepID=UPI0037835C3B